MRKQVSAGVTLLMVSALGVIYAQEQPKENRIIELMKEYTDAPAPPGGEGPVRDLLLRDLRAGGASVSVDGLGSVIGVVRGQSDQPRIMVDAHMDEVGLMVQYIRPDGFISFRTLGGWADQALIDQRWTILTGRGPVPAVTGGPDDHVWNAAQLARLIPRSEIFLDVGAKSKEDAVRLGIRPGDLIAPASAFTILANDRYLAKAWDDRLGCLIMVEALRKIKELHITLPNTIYFVGSTQEEIGERGAPPAVQAVKPDIGIALEGGLAGDVPTAVPEQAQEQLGGGPALFLYDDTMLPNRKLVDFFLNIAAEKKIALQTEVPTGSYGEDGAEIQRYDTGRPTICMVVPTRYMHGHGSVIDRKDFDRAVDLLVEILSRLDATKVRELSKF
jgi:putative aminopeptidase FrvX